MNQPSSSKIAARANAAVALGLVAIALIVTAGLAAPSARAASPASAATQLVQQPGPGGAPAQPIDVVVVLDDSGSMATCWPWPQGSPPFEPPCRFPSENPPSDPEELRYSAARLLLQLADDDDRLAVVRFDTIAEGVGTFGSLLRVGDGANRSQLIASLQPPTNYLPRGYTRIDLGLELATNLLDAVREPGRNQYVLLLTDGEPTSPAGAGGQRERIAAQLETLRNAGVLVFPVVLCNAIGGCPAEFLREQFANGDLNEAGTAQDLLQVFSEILTRMKPDRSLISQRNGAGALQFTTRSPQGVQSVVFVTPRGGLTALRRDDAPMLTSRGLDDPNIDVNVLESGNLADGVWTAETADPSGFAVVQAASYVELINPPPSLANSQASVRYYPAGKPPLLIARAVGPGAGETLLYNGAGQNLAQNNLEMEVFGQDNTRALLLSEEPTTVRLQLGADSEPLQLARTFRLEARDGLPTAEVFLPRPDDPGLLGDGRARLQVSFGAGANVANLAATAYVFEEAAGRKLRVPLAAASSEQNSGASSQQLAASSIVYQANMRCDTGICSDENFHPTDGRAYEVFYVLQGEVDNLRFSDWAQTSLELAPAVYLRGLPTQLDLSQMPAEGWPVELGSGTQEEIGSLVASIFLRNVETGEEVTGVTLDFNEEVPEEGALQTALRVAGLDSLRPGAYEGEIVLRAASPSGRPMNVTIRPGETLPVSLAVARPQARIDSQGVDFGEVLFDTSPNFHLDQLSYLPVSFSGQPFKITAQLVESSCRDISLVTGDLEERDGRTVLPLQLTSAGPVQPATCIGLFKLTGPNADYDVLPGQIGWQTRVASVEWSIVGGDLHLRDLQDAGARVQETLLVRFNGKTPFVVELVDLQGAGSAAAPQAAAEAAPIVLSDAEIDVPAVEVNGPPNEAGLYEVPLTFIARQAIPADQWRGTFYSGQMRLAIAGLVGDEKTVNFNFRSPSLYQRYLAPFVVPVYSLPWVICTGPLTLLLLLMLVARIRGRGFDDAELEQVAQVATREAIASGAVPEPAAPLPLAAATTARMDVAWGSSEWGSVWTATPGAGIGAAASAQPAAPGGNQGTPRGGDPWTSSW
jgi:hypothetical protein